jgi:hypothetical protein
MQSRFGLKATCSTFRRRHSYMFLAGVSKKTVLCVRLENEFKSRPFGDDRSLVFVRADASKKVAASVNP